MSPPPTSRALDLGSGLSILRRVEPPHAPWPALLAAASDGSRALLVDASSLDGWAGWRQGPADHLVTPLDLVRTADGHDVVLPAVIQRLDTFLRARAAHGAALGPGEVVTLAGSVLRGAGAVDPALTGEWWLTAEGRPMLVPGEGAPVVDGARILLRALRDVATERLAAVLDDLADAPSRGLRRDAAAGEDRLLACAAPTALRGVALPSDARLPPLPARVRMSRRDVPLSALDGAADGPIAPSLRQRSARRRRGVLDRLVAFWHAARLGIRKRLGERIPRVAPGDHAASMTTAPRRRRPAPILVALGAAVLTVVVVAALWPSGDPAPSPALSPLPDSATSSGPADHDHHPGSSPSPPVVVDPEPAPTLPTVAAGLLQRRAECRGAAECLAAVVEDPARAVPVGLVDGPDAARRIALLDDFGGVAVLRLDDPDGARRSQLIVMVSRNGEWLLRDVHDVAEQPS